MNAYVRECASQLFASLGHPMRLRILELLRSGEKTVNEVATELGLSQSGTSQHLAIMARAGILSVEQRGVSRFYRIRGPRVAQILDLITEFCQVHKLDEQARAGLSTTDDHKDAESSAGQTI